MNDVVEPLLKIKPELGKINLYIIEDDQIDVYKRNIPELSEHYKPNYFNVEYCEQIVEMEDAIDECLEVNSGIFTAFIVDLKMNGYSKERGLELIWKIREKLKYSLIIVITANFKNTKAKNSSIEKGANLFLGKGDDFLKNLEMALFGLQRMFRLFMDDREKYFKILDENDNNAIAELRQGAASGNVKTNESTPISKTVFKTKVIEKVGDEVLLVLDKIDSKNNSNEIRRWFKISRLGAEDSVQEGDCYILTDTVEKYGESSLSFEKSDKDLFNHKEQLKELFSKFKDPKYLHGNRE